ncbi:hypothetical protein ABZ446_13375 [Streptomyces sp. NPDC005813]|uniref:hypothetical protein n=1 Tax=Streptomyces sp. NPDC005813 TaxID=3155592 RepID=UPI0033FCAFC5
MGGNQYDVLIFPGDPEVFVGQGAPGTFGNFFSVENPPPNACSAAISVVPGGDAPDTIYLKVLTSDGAPYITKCTEGAFFPACDPFPTAAAAGTGLPLRHAQKEKNHRMR